MTMPQTAKRIRLPNNGWTPRPDQMRLWSFLQGGGTRAVEVAHRRFGKDDVALHFTATALHKRIGNYWHMLPKYEQARKVIWGAINPKTGMKRIDEAFPKALRTKTNEQEMKIEFHCGSAWQLVGSDNYNSFVGTPPVGVILSEWALANPLAWAYLSPILAENGGFALFIYTSRGNNHGRQMYYFAKNNPDWFCEMVKADQSPVFSAKQLEEEHNNLIGLFGPELGEALYQQEYFCSFEGAQLGAYYSKQIGKAREEKRITKVPYDPHFPVNTFWDLGVDDALTIWFHQHLANQHRFLDYYENTGEGLAHYAKILKDKDYIYGDHYLPHDGAARKLGETAETPQEILERLGIKPITIVQRPRDTMAVLRGIESGRNIITQCWFDEDKCAHGLMALEAYHTEYDEIKKKLGNAPAHDWASHGADAFRTFATGYQPNQGKVKTASEIFEKYH